MSKKLTYGVVKEQIDLNDNINVNSQLAKINDISGYSDEKDNIATDLMNTIQTIISRANNKNPLKTTKDKEKYNNNIKLGKEINNHISDMVDSNNSKKIFVKLILLKFYLIKMK